MENGLYSHLTNDSNVTAIVGTKVYGGQVAQAVDPPFIRFNRVSGRRVDSFSGHTGLANPRVQIDCYASTYGAVKQLADVVRKSINGFRGVMGTVRIGGARLLSDTDFFDDDGQLHRVSMDFSFWHDEATS